MVLLHINVQYISICSGNYITIGGGMLFQTSDETSTLTRPWDRFLKIVIFLSLEDTRPFTSVYQGCKRRKDKNRDIDKFKERSSS